MWSRKAYTNASEIGSPPGKWAVQPNRLSPAGVPVFYGAYDVATTKAETLDPVARAGKILSIGTFRPVRDLAKARIWHQAEEMHMSTC
jgi:hypothetical protein